MKETKICRRCQEDKPTTEFTRDARRKDGLVPYCKPCRRKINKEYTAKKADPDFKPLKKKREATASPFKPGLKDDLFVHFYRFNITLTEEEIERIICRLKNATSYWAEIDTIEAELGCKNYDVNMAELMRVEREHYNKNRDKYKGNQKQGVKMFSIHGEYIRSFETISDASAHLCGHRTKLAGAVGNCAAGRCPTAGGYIFEFSENFLHE